MKQSDRLLVDSTNEKEECERFGIVKVKDDDESLSEP